MNLLLLLSALLSALSGVGQAVRGVRAPQAVCAAATNCAVVSVRRRSVAARPVQELPRVAEAAVAVFVSLRLVPAEPLFAGRRRE